MRRYASARGNTSAVTLSMPRSGPASNSPMMATITPPIRAVTMDVCTALRTASRLPRPMALAMTTFAPRAMPMNRLRMSPVTGALEPTAATAAVPSDWEKLPTIMMPDALKSCSRMPVAATGSANRRTSSICARAACLCPACCAPCFASASRSRLVVRFRRHCSGGTKRGNRHAVL